MHTVRGTNIPISTRKPCFQMGATTAHIKSRISWETVWIQDYGKTYKPVNVTSIEPEREEAL